VNVGGVGETGCLAANLLAKEADLVIGVGTRFSDFTTSSKWIFQHPEVRFLNINVSNFDAWKLDGIAMLADAREALTALDAALADAAGRPAGARRSKRAEPPVERDPARLPGGVAGKSFVPEIDDHLDRESVYREFRQITDSTLTQSSVLGVLNETLPADAVIVAAAGSLPGDLQRVWRNRAENTYHVEYGYSCMGYEVNAALGVKLAQPQSEVYSLVGDGSFMMLHSELVTSCRSGRRSTSCCSTTWPTAASTTCRWSTGWTASAPSSATAQPETGQLQGGLVPVDFATIAAGYGCKTWRVTTLDELRHALDAARRETVSTLIDIKVLPKTMVHKYGSWWNVGVAQTALSERIRKVAQMINEKRAQARDY
jgi:3D-(3,5/4)-trihydroxycyclohexane-1,2-dione acylhydrolase (decyclizing)